MVLPTDLDIFRHMNNGVYFSIMDLARIDHLIRSGMMRLIRKAGYWPVIVAESIRFRRSLELFQRFEVETRVLGWDEKAFLMGHRFLRAHRRRAAMTVLAEAVIRVRFLSPQGAVPASEYLRLVGYPGAASPALPGWVADWNAVQASLRETGGLTINPAQPALQD
jgi:acyl-CoA thioesterase FadM